jgi:hypothetical protein
MEALLPFTILGTIGTSFYFFAKVFTDYLLKKKMIEKGYVSEETQSIFKNYSNADKYSALKWGLLFLSGGTSLIIMHSLDVSPETPLPYGIFTVGVSLGFLIYYFLVKKDSK